MSLETQQGRPAGNGTASKLNATSTPSVPAPRPADHAALPVAPVVAVRASKDTRMVVVLCPFCGKEHRHGLPYRATSTGYASTRVRHCDVRVLRRMPDDGPTSYRLQYPRPYGPGEVDA